MRAFLASFVSFAFHVISYANYCIVVFARSDRYTSSLRRT